MTPANRTRQAEPSASSEAVRHVVETCDAPPEAADAEHVPWPSRVRRRLALLLRSEDAAAYIGVSRSEFYRLDTVGLIPEPVRFGKVKRWSRLELRSWVQKGCPPRDVWKGPRK